MLIASACLGLFVIGLYPQISVGSQNLVIEADSQKVGRYEKVEFLIHLDTMYGNPFDPDEVELDLELTTPDGRKITIPAFYYQHYEKQYLIVRDAWWDCRGKTVPTFGSLIPRRRGRIR